MASTQPPYTDDEDRVISSYGAQDSPFLSLPGELRNETYSHVFASSAYYFKSRRRSPGSSHSGRPSIGSARHHLTEGRSGLPLMLTCRQTYCETFDSSLQLSTFIFSCLSILPRCTVLPTHVLTRIQTVRFLESITVERNAQLFLDEVLLKGLELRDLLPNIKLIEYNVRAAETTADEFLEINGPHYSSYGVVQQWFENAGEVELRRRIV